MNYKPVVNPVDKHSDDVKVQLTRFTGMVGIKLIEQVKKYSRAPI